MGTFTSPNQRTPYLPPLDTGDGSSSASRSTLLGGDLPASNDWISTLARQRQGDAGRDPNIVPVADPGPSPAGDDGQIAPAPASAPSRGRSAVAPPVEPPSNSPELERAFQDRKGRRVILPDGSPVADPYSSTGYLMSPFDDLSNVAQGGMYDYQRRRYEFGKDGFTQLPQFRNVSNVNVGLFCQQAGLPLWLTLGIAGRYAAKNSSNAKPDEPYGLDRQTRAFIELGHKLGQSGVFTAPNPSSSNH
jgi:hypothetical protein